MNYGPEVSKAVDRGRERRGKRYPKWEPVGVTYPGWLTARIENVGTGRVECVKYAQGCWQHSQGENVKDRELKKIAKAMVGVNGPTRDALLVECAAARAIAVAEQVTGMELRRLAKEGSRQ